MCSVATILTNGQTNDLYVEFHFHRRLDGKHGAGVPGYGARGTGSRGVENTGCGKRGVWKTRGQGGKHGVWWKTRDLSGKHGFLMKKHGKTIFSPKYEFSSLNMLK